MKKLYSLFAIIIISFIAKAQVAKNVIVEHFTNTYCSVCASRNPGFYNNLWQFPQVLHIAYHPSSPYAACPLNQHNKAENDARTNFYGVYGATPRIVIQGTVIPSTANYNDPALFQNQLGQTTPFDVSVSLHKINSGTIEVRAIVKKLAASSLTNVQLYGAIVEDTLFFTANNGETRHYDVFRKSVWGNPLIIAAPSNVGDSSVQMQQLSLHTAWDEKRIYSIVLLQDANNEVVQAAKSNHLPDPMNIHGIQGERFTVFPNPANDRIRIEGIEQKATIQLVDTKGCLLRNETTVTNQELDISGLTSGIYFLKIISSEQTKTVKLIKD